MNNILAIDYNELELEELELECLEIYYEEALERNTDYEYLVYLEDLMRDSKNKIKELYRRYR